MRKPSGTWRRAYMVRIIRPAPVSKAMDRATSLMRSMARARLWRRSPAWLRPLFLKPASVPAQAARSAGTAPKATAVRRVRTTRPAKMDQSR